MGNWLQHLCIRHSEAKTDLCMRHSVAYIPALASLSALLRCFIIREITKWAFLALLRIHNFIIWIFYFIFQSIELSIKVQMIKRFINLIKSLCCNVSIYLPMLRKCHPQIFNLSWYFLDIWYFAKIIILLTNW